MSQYKDFATITPIVASTSARNRDDCGNAGLCQGSASDWMSVTFADYFSSKPVRLKVLSLTIVCSVSRLVAFPALVKLM